MLPDLMHIDVVLFGLALAIGAAAVGLSRFLWLRVGREDGRKAKLYSLHEFIADHQEYVARLRKEEEDRR